MLIVGQGARVYRNLHKQAYSIQQLVLTRQRNNRLRTVWRVQGHRTTVYLTDVTFKVYESGRQRVLATRKENIHAYVLGRYWGPHFLEPEWFSNSPDIVSVRYNPYAGPYFQDRDGQFVSGAEAVWLTPGGLYARNPTYYYRCV